MTSISRHYVYNHINNIYLVIFVFYLSFASLQPVSSLKLKNDSEALTLPYTYPDYSGVPFLRLAKAEKEKCILDDGETKYDDCEFNPDCFGVTCKRLGNTFKMIFDCETGDINVSLNKKTKILKLNERNVIKDGLSQVIMEPFLLSNNPDMMMFRVRYGTIFCSLDGCLFDGMKQLMPSNTLTLCKSMEWAMDFRKKYPKFLIKNEPVNIDFAMTLALLSANLKNETPIWVEDENGKLQKLFSQIENFDIDKILAKDEVEDYVSDSGNSDVGLIPNVGHTTTQLTVNIFITCITSMVGILFITVFVVLSLRRYRKYTNLKNQDSDNNKENSQADSLE